MSLIGMTSLSQLETYTNELVAATKALATHCRDAGVGSTPHLTVPDHAPFEVHRARRDVLANAARLQTLLAEPGDFIQHLASQVRTLSHSSAARQLILLYRTNSLHVCNGWASFRCLHVSRSVAASLPRTSPTWLACLRRNYAVLCA